MNANRIFKHRLNTGMDGTFFNMPDTVFPSLNRAAAIADLLEVANINGVAPDTLQKAAEAIRLEIMDAEALIEAYIGETSTSAQAAKEVTK